MAIVPKPRRGFKSEDEPRADGILTPLLATQPHAQNCATRSAGGNWPCTCGVEPRATATGVERST